MGMFRFLRKKLRIQQLFESVKKLEMGGGKLDLALNVQQQNQARLNQIITLQQQFGGDTKFASRATNQTVRCSNL